MSCFQCIPKFVWEIIFETLKHDPLALVNCWKASPIWAQMLASKKQDFMICVVLQLLTKQLAFDDLKNCRLVSQNWKQAVDGLNYTAPKLYFYFKKGHWLRTVLPHPFNGWTEWRVAECANRLSLCQRMDDIKIPSMNPFASRVVHFKAYNTYVRFNSDLSQVHYQLPNEHVSRDLECEKGFLEMVERFGKHIWHLVITTGGRVRSDFIRNIVVILNSTPEIKSLTLYIKSGIFHWTRDVSELILLLRLGHLLPFCVIPPDTEVDCEVEQSAPILPCLTSLSMPYLIISGISKYLITTYKDQLESLECGGLVMPPVDKERPLEFPKLLTLKMRRCGSYLYQLDSVIAPCLEQLILWLEVNACALNIFCNLIDAIRHLSPSLVELRTYGGFELYLSAREGNYRNLLEYFYSFESEQEKSYDDRMEEEKAPPVVSCQFLRLKTFRIHFLFLNSPHLRWLLSHFPFLHDLHFERSKGEEKKFTDDYGYRLYPQLLGAEGLADLWCLLPNLQNIYFSTRCKGDLQVIKRP